MSNNIVAARQLLANGDKIGARALLMPLARSAPTGEVWYLLGQALDDPAQRRDCLVRAAQAGWVEPLAAPAPAPAPAPVQAPAPAPTPPPAAIAAPVAAQHAPVRPIVPPSGPTDRQLLEKASQAYVSRGWQIVSQSEHAIQFKKAKRASELGLVVFVLLPLIGGCLWFPLFGVAIVGLLFVGVDYLLKNDKLEYVTADQLRNGRGPLPGGAQPYVPQPVAPRVPLTAAQRAQRRKVGLALLGVLGLALVAGGVWTLYFLYSNGGFPNNGFNAAMANLQCKDRVRRVLDAPGARFEMPNGISAANGWYYINGAVETSNGRGVLTRLTYLCTTPSGGPANVVFDAATP